MKVVIMAGGKGTRISSIANDIPKPMLKIEGIPVLEREIQCLREQGFTDIIITIGHLGKVIKDYFGDGTRVSPITNREFGVHIEYYEEKEALGNAGALFKIRNKLDSDFLLLNADAVFDVDFNRFIQFHYEHKGLVTLFTHPNSHPYDSSIIIANHKGVVEQWLSKENRNDYYPNRVNAGLHIVSPKVLDNSEVKGGQSETLNGCGQKIKIDLDRDILKPLAGTGDMYCYDSSEYVKDMGTPDRYYSVCNDFKEGLLTLKNLKKKQKAIFMDRDGTVNKYVGYLKNVRDLELIEGVTDAIRKINASGYLAIIVTNQPVVARGEVTFDYLDKIHNKIEMILGNNGAYVDAVYFCPHHPDKGYEGEISTLKIECECRKPKPGMIFAAAKKYNIDLANSWMIGDSEIDIQCGINAGCKTALIGHTDCKVGQNVNVNSLLDFVDKYIEMKDGKRIK